MTTKPDLTTFASPDSWPTALIMEDEDYRAGKVNIYDANLWSIGTTGEEPKIRATFATLAEAEAAGWEVD